jgi:predicted Zn finger-like uncharacterized protein
VKFLCDRCKTRYSIGDERVRGKILKIRCKNCANVITVREGMASDPDADPAARAKKVTSAPEALPETSAEARSPSEPRATRTPVAALDPARTERPRAAAQPASERARAAAQPVGPGRTDLGDRARTGQPQRAGADDAARRQGSAAAAPRSEPVSALGAAFVSAMAKPPPALDEEWYVSIDGDQAGPYSLSEAQQWVAQKPFEAELHCWSEGFDDWLPIDKVSHFRGLRKRPPAGLPPPLPRVGGVAAARAALASPVEDDPKPLFAATMASLERGAPASQGLSLPALGATAPRTNGAVPVTARPAPFEPTGPDPAEAPTQLEAMRFADPILAPRRDQPAAAPGPARSSDAALTSPHMPSARAGSPVSEAANDFGDDDDGELAIGEVSRVVNLGDVTRKRSDRAASPRRTTPLPGTAARPATLGAGAGAGPRRATSTGAAVVEPAAADVDPGISMAPIATSHRRGLIALLSVAIVLVLGVIGAVILLVTTDDEPLGGRLGTVRDIDTSRPDNPITARSLDPANPTNPVPNPLVPRPPRPRITAPPTETVPDPALGDALRGDEVEDVARRYQDTTQRCYLRSQRGADSILIGDVKKIGVTLTIDTAGNVSDIQLSDHAANNLGKCLTTTMKGWKFRTSPGGTFKFSLNFVGS